MKKYIAILILILISTSAFAQSPEEIAACQNDAIKVCKATIKSVPANVLACLRANKLHISAKCNAVLARYGF